MTSDESSLLRMQKALAEKPLSPEARAKIEAHIVKLKARIANPEPSQRLQILASQLVATQQIPTGDATPATLTTWYAELEAA